MLSSSTMLAAGRILGSTTSRGRGTLTAKCLSSQQSWKLSTAAPAAAANARVEEVTFIRLNNLQDNPGAVKKKRRVGRGPGSSKGKTCGKGHKGQRARNKSSIPTGFEGGQTKFWKTLPKKGFSNKRARQKHGADMIPINLGTIQDYIDMGRIKIDDNSDADDESSTNTTIGVVELIESGMLKKTPSLPGVKLLAKGKERFRTPVRFVVNRASEEAIQHTESLGGEVVSSHMNRLAMRALISPEKFPKMAAASGDDEGISSYLLPKQARPPPKLQPYYTSWKNRGYLCPQVQMREWLRARPELKDSFEKALETIKEEDEEKEKVGESSD